MGKTAYIGIGSNLGDAVGEVKRAMEALEALPLSRLEASSSLFRTAPVDAGGDDFINAVVQLSSTYTAHELLTRLQEIEAAAGRERPYRNAPRTLDLDLLLYGDECIDMPTLQVPHPRMTERAFVLIPLLQLDPFVSIPGKGPAHEFVARVSDQRISKISAP
ncbi:MAG: folK [Paucimonas sp.]|jgi:2-amino-4-hydroxy-6-hydroxymethyldihydropteridine diphosphokinase|nr:folK [Paucimonas sp.]